MSARTAIEWADSTANPTMGCNGCELRTPTNKSCYAGALVDLRQGRPGYPRDFDHPQLFPGRMKQAACWPPLAGLRRPEKPWLNGRPRMIFLSDMGDALSSSIRFEYLLTEVVEHVRTPPGNRHRWLWLTKRPERMLRFSSWLQQRGFTWPRNLWVGTSVTAQANVKRLRPLLTVGDDATRRFVSVEPQVEAIEFPDDHLRGLHWVIQGGQSRQGGQSCAEVPAFSLAWARDLRDQCARLGVPYFLKQAGSRPTDGDNELKLQDRHGGAWEEWPADLRVRQVPR